MSEDYEDYYPPICFHCDGRLSSVTLEKTYNWNQEIEKFVPDDYEALFTCIHCHSEIGEITKEGDHKWYVPESSRTSDDSMPKTKGEA